MLRVVLNFLRFRPDVADGQHATVVMTEVAFLCLTARYARYAHYAHYL